MTGRKDDLARVQIDENLKHVFEQDAQQELSQDLLSLLDRLDDVEVPIARQAGAPAQDEGHGS